MGLADSILANEKIMDKLAQIYANTLSVYYGNGKRGTDREAKNDMIYFLEQNCGVCQTPSAISAQLAKIWGKIQEAARKYGYRGPIMQPKPEGLPSYLQQIAEKVLADEKVMQSLGASCYYATTRKNLVKGAMMSEKYWGSYPNELMEWVRSRNWGYLSFNDAKQIIRFIKKDIAKYARLYAKEEEANKAAAEAQGGEMNEMDEIGNTKKMQKLMGMAGARRAERDGEYNARGTWGERDYVGSVLPGYTTSDVPIYKHAAKEWGNNPKLRDSFVKGVQKQYKKMTGNKNGDPISLYEGLDELSPKLLQHASDKAWDLGRYSQSEKLEDEAGKRAQREFGAADGIRVITPKKISYESATGAFCAIFRDGSYSCRPRSGYNNESGNLPGSVEFPKEMRVTDKRAARALSRWWKTYYIGGNPCPVMEDWHNLLEW